MSEAEGRNITTIHVGLTDHFDPEVQAMMLAMYSRNYGPIASRLPTTPDEEASLKSRLEKFYVGYGHKSVGQLGSTTIHLEGVSQIAAKAIENHPLYNGQESSTRYIDFSNQPMIVPQCENNEAIAYWQEKWRVLYLNALPMTIEKLEAEYPFDWTGIGDCAEDGLPLDQKERAKFNAWRNTIKARAFDICRGLLPAGVVTNVGFTGTFDLINDHFGEMLHHPSSEMRDLAARVLLQLQHKYSHATPGVDKLRQRFAYVNKDYFYTWGESGHRDHLVEKGHPLSERTVKLINQRKKYEALPKAVSSRHRYLLSDKIDFGSFRDLHRHRNGVILMPYLTSMFGIEDWYLQQLPVDIAKNAAAMLDQMDGDAITVDSVAFQYAVPMGARVHVHYECDLNQLLYLFELRSGKTVHQTLRHYMHRVQAEFMKKNDAWARITGIYSDLDEDNFTLKRGEQTFSGEFK